MKKVKRENISLCLKAFLFVEQPFQYLALTTPSFVWSLKRFPFVVFPVNCPLLFEVRHHLNNFPPSSIGIAVLTKVRKRKKEETAFVKIPFHRIIWLDRAYVNWNSVNTNQYCMVSVSCFSRSLWKDGVSCIYIYIYIYISFFNQWS